MPQTKHARWKIQPKESFKHKISKPQTFRKFSNLEKSLILLIVIASAFFVGSVASWQMDLAAYNARQAVDPFTTIWNGQTAEPDGLNGYTPGAPQFVQALSTAAGYPCSTQCTVNIVPKYIGDAIIVTIFGGFSPSFGFSFAVTDAASSTYTFLGSNQNNDFNHIGIVDYSTFSPFGLWNSPGSNLAVNITRIQGNTWGAIVSEWSGVSQVQNVGSCNATNTYPTQFLTCNYQDYTTPISQPFVELGTSTELSNIACPNPIVDVNGTAFAFKATNNCAGNPTPSFGVLISSPVLPADNDPAHFYNITYQNSGSAVQYNAFQTPIQETVLGLQLLGNLSNQCNAGYQCFFSKSGVNGTITLYPTTDHDSVMLTNTTIDMSTSVSKELAIFETWLAQESSLTVGKSFGYYMTVNGTLPQDTGYNPLLDQSVALAVIVYYEGSHHWNATVYMQKVANQELVPASGLGFDPKNCSTSATLYLCERQTQNLTGFPSIFQMLSPVFNFTGGATPGNSASQNSYLCFTTQASSPFCNVGGAGTSVIAIQSPNASSYILPWFRVQGFQYHLGFWAEKGLGAASIVQFGNMQGCANGAALCGRNLDAQANVISVYVPNPATVPPNFDPAGWFGSMGNLFVANTCTGLKVITLGLADPCTAIANAPRDLTGSVASGFAQFFYFLLFVYQNTLNTIGNFLGLGNIGDTFVAIVNAMGSLIVNGFSAIVGFFVGLGALINSGYFSFLAGAAVLIGTLLPFAIVLWKIVFNGAFTVTDLLFFDYVFGMFLVAKAIKERKSALKAFFGWISFNIFLFTFIFEATWAIFDIVTRPIHRTKQIVDPMG